MEISRPKGDGELRQALGDLVQRPGLSIAQRDAQVDALLRYAGAGHVALDHCLVAREGKRIRAVCLLVAMAGRAGSVFIPNDLREAVRRETTIVLLQRAAEVARDEGLQFLQCTVEDSDSIEQQLFRQGGFEFLARLVYLERDLADPLPDSKAARLTWQVYSQETHDLFAHIVEGTYEKSLDCNALNGLRRIEDVLASHQSVGRFNPKLWRVALVDQQPVGVVLLAEIVERLTVELVYMGILPAFRGRGYGAVLLGDSIRLARTCPAVSMTLSVDAKNSPARRLYARFGFKEAFERDVLINVLSEVPRSKSI